VHFDDAASEANVNALCGGGKNDPHTILILHGNSLSPHVQWSIRRHPRYSFTASVTAQDSYIHDHWTS
jgi:hypothetical protein